MKISGKLIKIEKTQKISEKFQKKIFIIEYAENPQYPEYLKFELMQNKCTMIDQFKIGEQININFNLKGRKWINPEGEAKYFNSLQCWYLEKKNKNQSIENENNENENNENNENIIEKDDLPF